MSNPSRPELPPRNACATCGREIDPADAKSAETQDYLLYFCGLDCFQQWFRAQEEVD